MRILQRGDTGSDVRTAQTALIRAGYDPGAANGGFGAATERAVMQFQRVLGATRDGIIGPVTWQFLEPFALESNPDVLRRGSRGAMVRRLQEALEASGNSPGRIDGLFGTKTQAALRAFQRSAMLAQTGVADRATWLAIAPYIDYGDVYLRRGDRGMLVTILQTALTSAGFSPGQADGIFGSRTFNAVTAFQRANRITADGIAGRATQDKLYSASAQPKTVSASTTESGYTLLKEGASGLEVRKLQGRLAELGYYAGGVDGIYASSRAHAF